MKQFFCDGNGELSSCRLICFLFALTSIGLAFFCIGYAISKAQADIGGNMVALVLGFAGIATTGKVVQKALE